MTKKSIDTDIGLLTDYGIYVPAQTIMLTGEVDEAMYERLVMGLMLIEHDKNATSVNIELSSDGGCWYNGIAIYDRIKSCKLPVTIRVAGAAMSMASVILQAGDTRLITPGSTIMVHDGSSELEGTPENIQAWAKQNKDICEYMYKIYAESSLKPVSYWRKHCRKDFILNSEEAINLGLVDGLI